MRTVQDGDYIWAAEWMNLTEAIPETRMWIEDDMAPSWDTGMDTEVATGKIFYDYGLVTAGAIQGLSHDTEAVLDVRYDLIVLDNTATASIVKGTTNKVAPDLPADRILVAVVRIENGVAALTANDVFDCRVVKESGIISEGSGIAPAGGQLDVTITSAHPFVVAFKTNSAVNGYQIIVQIESINTGADDMKVSFVRQDAVGGNCNIEYRITKDLH